MAADLREQPRPGLGPAQDEPTSAGPTRRIRAKPDPRLSRSLEYGMAMLESFDPAKPSLGIAELAEEIGIGRSTAHRYALTLVMLGYLEQDAKRKYRLAARAQEPGRAAIETRRRAAPAKDVLCELRDWTGHTVSLATLHETRALYLHRLLGHRHGQHDADLQLGVGTSVPLHCSAVGKALLATITEEDRMALLERLPLTRYGPNTLLGKRRLADELARVRASGVAISDEELAAGVRAIAVPVATEPGVALGALAVEVTAPAGSCSVAQLRRDALPLLIRAAERIAQAAQAPDETA